MRFIHIVHALWLFLNSLLRCNSPTLQVTYLKCTNVMIFIVFRVVQPSPQSILEHFHPPEKKPHTHCHHLPSASLPSPHPRQPLIYFQSLWICLFWTFHINGIIQYVVFCNWLLPLSIMLSRFIQVVARISTSLFFHGWIVPHFMNISQFLYPVISWWIFGLIGKWLILFAYHK